MRPLKVTSIQRGCVYDGRGIRTTVFLKGCTLHCPWCCNPEAIRDDDEVFIDESKCLKNSGISARFCESCERSDGANPVTMCPLGVGQNVATDYMQEAIYEILVKDYELFARTGGGITFSGGEPLLQAEALLPLVQRLAQANIDVMFETTLVVPTEYLVDILPYAHGFLVDLKLQPQMKLYDTAYLDRMKTHLRMLKDMKRITNRLVFVDAMIAHKERVVSVLQELGIHCVELLSCHDLGAKKYEKLALSHTHKNFSADSNLLVAFSEYLKEQNVQTSILVV